MNIFSNPVAMLILGVLLTGVASLLLAFRSERRLAQIKAADIIEASRVVRDTRIAELERQLALVVQAQAPISAAFQALLVKELTHFHTPIMDALLVKLGPPYTLSSADERELREALKSLTEEMNGLLTESEREAALMLPMVIKRVKAEAAMGIGVSDEQINAVAAKGGIS